MSKKHWLSKYLEDFAVDQKRIKPSMTTDFATNAILDTIKSKMPEELNSENSIANVAYIVGWNHCLEAVKEALLEEK